MSDPREPEEIPAVGAFPVLNEQDAQQGEDISVDLSDSLREPFSRRLFFKLMTFSWVHFLIICGCFGAWFGRFLFPNVRFEPPTRFKVGKPESFLPWVVDTRFKKRYGIWIVRTDDQIFALSTVCTHLGCTPNWLTNEEKFKCPCHGSGFSLEGINFEGPAPRPLERFLITLDDSGTIVVDKDVVFRQEKAEWALPGAFLSV